jgi:hypothetical protein
MQGRAGQGRTGQGRAGQGRAGQGRAGQGRAGQGRAGSGPGSAGPGSGKLEMLWGLNANWRYHKHSAGRVFDYKLRCFVAIQIFQPAYGIQAQLHQDPKTCP